MKNETTEIGKVVLNLFSAMIFIGAIIYIYKQCATPSDDLPALETNSVVSDNIDSNYQKNVDKANEDNDSVKGAKIDEILQPFKRSYDEVQEIAFYHTKNRPILGSNIYLYLCRKNNNVWTRLVIDYYGEDWLFVRNWTLKTDIEKREIYATSDIKRDNSSEHVWEICDMPLEGKMQSIPLVIIASKKSILRFNGDDYYHDMKISESQKKAITAIWDAQWNIDKLND